MQPFSNESMSWGRFASSVRVSASGFRLPSPRNHRRLSRRTQREQRSEISISGHDNSMLGGSALEDHIVVGVLQSY
jgi:hypothetical protein